MTVEDRIAALESMVASQHAEIVDLRTRLDSAPSGSAVSPVDPAGSAGASLAQRSEAAAPTGAATTSRRRLLTGGAVAAGAAVVGATVAPQSAAAADGDPLRIGQTNASEGGNTFLRGDGATPYNNRNIFTVGDQNNSSTYEAAIGAYGEGDRVSNGLYGFTGDRDDGDSTTGYALVANNVGGRANLMLVAGGGTPTSDTFLNRRGAMRHTANGDLWFCTSSGSPGSWRKLAGPSSSGAIHAIAPARVYDSRFVEGPLANGEDRLLSVADSLDVTTGELVQSDVVPSGATSVFFNVTLASTTGAGFVLVSPGTATEITGSTINWSGPDQVIANASLTTIDDTRSVRVFAGGAGSTEFIIDVTGYTL